MYYSSMVDKSAKETTFHTSIIIQLRFPLNKDLHRQQIYAIHFLKIFGII